jgi:hypothetical protein
MAQAVKKSVLEKGKEDGADACKRCRTTASPAGRRRTVRTAAMAGCTSCTVLDNEDSQMPGQSFATQERYEQANRSMNKLLQFFSIIICRSDSIGKTLGVKMVVGGWGERLACTRD